MIERQFIEQNMKEFLIQEYVTANVSKGGHSHTKMQRTPLGEKIIVFASRPGLIVGRKGANIKKLTKDLKKKFNLENPQIEISEVEDIYLDAQIVAEMIASSLERFGTDKFKGIGHKMMTEVMGSGAAGIEIKISGKIPGARAKSWRFYQGYLKKCGDIATTMVRNGYSTALLKTGIVGIKVKIMPMEGKTIDEITIKDVETVEAERVVALKKEEVKKQELPKKKEPKKRVKKEKVVEKKEEVKVEEKKEDVN